MIYMLRSINDAESQTLNCYMIYVKKDKCRTKLAAATRYMLRRINVVQSWQLLHDIC